MPGGTQAPLPCFALFLLVLKGGAGAWIFMTMRIKDPMITLTVDTRNPA